MKPLEVLKAIWSEINTIVELFIYLSIAFAIEKLFGVTYLEAISIVFIYFIMNIVRIVVETYRNRI